MAWATSALCAARASPLLGPWATVGWMMVFGALATVPICLVMGIPGGMPILRIGLLAFIGLANPLGLTVQYIAYRYGKVAVVAAVVSTEGAIAGLIAVLAGDRLLPVEALGLIVVTVGVFAAAFARDPGAEPGSHSALAALLALLVAGLFGAGVFVTGEVGSESSFAVALIPARLTGLCLFVLPLVLRGQFRLTRAAAPFVVTGGLAEVVGVTALVVGSGDSLAVTAALSSQWAAMTSVGAFVFLGQRLSRAQVAGIVTIALGVATVAVARL